MSTDVPMLRVRGFILLSGHRLRVQFSNGEQYEVDLRSELDLQVFAPLRDLAYFRQARLNPETGTVEWPNGADFAPEFLYRLATSVADRRGQA